MEEMDLGKEASEREIPPRQWTFVGGGWHMSDACGLPHKCRDALKMQAGLMHLLEELCIRHYGKKKAWLLQGAGLYWGLQQDTDAQLQAEEHVRKLEELRTFRRPLLWLRG